MNGLSEQCHIRTWCDVMAASVPLWAYWMAAGSTTALWWAVAIFTIGLIGLCIGIWRHGMEEQVRHPLLCRYISMTACYVWPPILGVLICLHYNFDPLGFYVLTGIAVVAIIVTDRCKI